MVGLIKELLPRIATLERATKLGNWSARFITMVKLLDELKAGMDEQQERMVSYSQVLLEYRDAYLLALDDLGVEKLTPFVANVFYALLDERGKRGLPTLLTSNLGLKALEAHLTPRVFSRLLYMVDTLEVTGPDLRLLAAARRVQEAH
jgi:DNA replication protein DnaC